jgi:uncharacterized protein (TIGR02246 family)
VAADPLVVLRRFAERLEAGDATGLAALFAPDAEYSEPPRFAFAGRDAIAAFFADFAARHHAVSFAPVRALADPDGALLAVEWHFAHTRRADGARATYAGMSWVDLADGLIARWRGFSARLPEDAP